MFEQGSELAIGAIDVWQLRKAVRWPIMRLLARHFVDQVALHQYMRELLESERWSSVRVVPHTDDRHVYDVFGVPRPRPVLPVD